MVKREASAQASVAATSFIALFSIVGLALYGLPLYYGNKPEERSDDELIALPGRPDAFGRAAS